jgi:hypothetical protein
MFCKLNLILIYDVPEGRFRGREYITNFFFIELDRIVDTTLEKLTFTTWAYCCIWVAWDLRHSPFLSNY